MSSNPVTNKTELGLPIHEPSTAPSSPSRLPRSTLRTEATAFIGEFIGTFMFLSLAFTGTQIAVNAKDASAVPSIVGPNVGKLLYIAFAFGVSLAINVAIFAELSGGKFNPAVSSSRPLVLPTLGNWRTPQ
jgi:aquaporin related protein